MFGNLVLVALFAMMGLVWTGVMASGRPPTSDLRATYRYEDPIVTNRQASELFLDYLETVFATH